MERTGRRLSYLTGPGALLLVIVMVGTGAALLTGAAPAPIRDTGSSVILSLPGDIWAVMFVTPLIVGFAVYLLQWTIMTPLPLRVRFGAGAAIIAVTVAVVAALVLHADWSSNSTVAVGTSGGPPGYSGPGGSSGTGHGTGNGSSGVGSTNGTGGLGTGGNGTGRNGTGGNGTTGNGTGGKGAGGNGTGGNGTRGNNTTGSGGGAGGSGANNTTLLSGANGGDGGLSLSVSNWVFLGVAAALSVGVAILAIPGVLPRFGARPSSRGSLAPPVGSPPPRPAKPYTPGVPAAGESPRMSIVRLYRSLVGRVGLSPEEVAARTAEEIQQTRLAELRVSAVSASILTTLFEEACYSGHPIGPAEVDRFVQNVRVVERELFVGGVLR